ncbi:hypothetical protein ACR30L_12000 [Psychromonas sp. PT13]|uniref:hypothetical protein n=1 Tax=Psychromonas sp. PT13 TaxID=3439547 RepID=UPI003EBBEC2E
MTRVLLIIICIISLFCAYLWLSVDHLTVKNATLLDDIAQYQIVAKGNSATIKQLKESMTERDRLLAKQYKTNQTLRDHLQHKQRELIQLGEEDEQVKAWANQPVPDAITRLLNSTRDSDKD